MTYPVGIAEARRVDLRSDQERSIKIIDVSSSCFPDNRRAYLVDDRGFPPLGRVWPGDDLAGRVLTGSDGHCVRCLYVSLGVLVMYDRMSQIESRCSQVSKIVAESSRLFAFMFSQLRAFVDEH